MPRAVNSNWGKMNSVPTSIQPTAFEKKVDELKLSSDEYFTSKPLRDWVIENRHTRYVPELLLRYWGLNVDTSF